MKNRIKNSLLEAQSVLQAFLANEITVQHIENAGRCMVEALQQGHKIMSCGNGGSMADAMHFAEELTGRFRDDRPPIAALSISDPTHISCTANDYGFEQVFSRYVQALGKPGDVLLAISTSGNSANVIKAVEMAKEMGITVVALTGKSGGTLATLADVEIRVPETRYSDRTQEIHILTIHILIDYIEQCLVADS